MNKRAWIRVAGCVLLFGAALIAYPVAYHSESRLRDTAFESLAVACSLADHGTFADPFYALKTGPTAHLAPAYPAFLGMLVYHFGDGPRGAFALQWCATVFMGLQLALFPWAALRMGMGYAAGFLAACLWLAAGIPKFDLGESTPYGALLLLLACLSFPRDGGAERGAVSVLAGILWGISWLLNPAGILVLAAWLAWMYFSRRLSGRRVALTLLVPLAVVAPWMVRNRVALNHFVFVRDNLGLELAVSNTDCANWSFEISRSTGCFEALHPNISLPEAQKLLAVGEVEYNRRRMQEALHWIGANPKRFGELTAQRFAVFWLPSLGHFPWEQKEDVPRRRFLISALTVASIPGLVLLWLRQRLAALWCLAWLVLFPPVYYVTQYIERYRNPILWVTFLPAAYFLVEVTRLMFREQAAGA